MSESNGTVTTEVAEQIVQAETAPPKVWLNTGALKPRDMIRARIALRDVLGKRAPLEMLNPEGDEFFPFLIWCQRSRSDPSFTWDDALDTDFEDCTMGDTRPPQIEPLSSSGSKPGKSAGRRSNGKRPNAEPASSSESSSG